MILGASFFVDRTFRRGRPSLMLQIFLDSVITLVPTFGTSYGQPNGQEKDDDWNSEQRGNRLRGGP